MAQKWLRNPFQQEMLLSGIRKSLGSVGICLPSACWLFNEGHCKFHGLFKYKLKFSAIDWSHAAIHCPTQQMLCQSKVNAKDHSEYNCDGVMGRPVLL